MNRHFCQDIHVANKHMKRWPVSLANREMQTKTTVRYGFIFPQLAGRKKTKTGVGGDAEEPAWPTAGGKVNSVASLENSSAIPHRVKRSLGDSLSHSSTAEQHVHTKTRAHVCVAALFVMTRKQGQPRWPSADEWINTTWSNPQ